MICQPHDVKSLAGDTHCRISKCGLITTVWLLDVAGDFCLWPKKDMGVLTSRMEILSGAVSAQIGMHVRYSRKGQTVGMHVVVDAGTRQRAIEREYERATRKR